MKLSKTKTKTKTKLKQTQIYVLVAQPAEASFLHSSSTAVRLISVACIVLVALDASEKLKLSPTRHARRLEGVPTACLLLDCWYEVQQRVAGSMQHVSSTATTAAVCSVPLLLL